MRFAAALIAVLAMAASVEAIDTHRYRKSIRSRRSKAKAHAFPPAPALDGSERRPPLCLDEDFFGGGSSYKALAPTADEKAVRGSAWIGVVQPLGAVASPSDLAPCRFPHCTPCRPLRAGATSPRRWPRS